MPRIKSIAAYLSFLLFTLSLLLIESSGPAWASQVLLRQVGVGARQYASERPRWNFSSGDEDSPDLPGDFFDPGSEPFVGTVEFNFVDDASFRLNNVPDPGDLPPGGTTTVIVDVLQLDLRSSAPIEVDTGGGTQLYDVHLTTLPGSRGGLVVDHDLPDGGTVYGGQSTLDLVYRIDFAPAGQAPDGSLFLTNEGGSPLTLFLQDDTPWRNALPGAGPSELFILGSDGSQLLPWTLASSAGSFEMELLAVPEPSTLLLALVGGAVSIGAVRRRGERR